MQSNAVYGNGADINLATPWLNGYNVSFTGTFGEPEPNVFMDDGAANTLNSVSVIGHSSQAEAWGGMFISAPNYGNLTITNGIDLSYGVLAMGFVGGGTITLDGDSSVANDSTFTVLGRQYQSIPYTLNGHMTVSNGSKADLSSAPLQGNATIEVESGSTVDLDRVVAGINIDLDNGVLLDVNRAGFGSSAMSFLGTIHEASAGVVDVMNATTAVEEVFRPSTGLLDLLNGSGATVEALKFAGNLTLYTTPDNHGGMDITTMHNPGSLPTIFTH